MDRTFVQSQRYKDQQMRANREGANLDILDFEKRLVTRLRKLDIPVFAHSVWRDAETQAALHKAGHSKAKFGSSPHNYGMAVDIVHGVKAWDLDPKAWAAIGHLGKEIAMQSGIPITWGGDWDFYDPAHWEIKHWKLIKDAARMQPGQSWT